MNNTSIFMIFLLSFPLLMVGVVCFWALRKPKNVNLIRVYLVAFSLHFGVMPLYGFISDYISERHSDFTEDEVVYTYFTLYLYVFVVLISLFLFDRFVRRKKKHIPFPALLDLEFKSISIQNAVLIFVIVVGFLLTYNIAFGYTYYGSGSLERNLSVPYPLVVVKSLLSILVFGLVGYGAIHLIKRRKYAYLGLLLLCSNNFLDWYSRRTYLLAVVILVFLKLIIDRFRVSFREVLVVSVVLIFILQVFFPFLYVFRSLTNENKTSQGDINIGISYQESQSNKGRLIGKDQSENTAFRANQIARNTEIMRYPLSSDSYMGGLLVLTQIAAVIPRTLNPSKLETSKLLSPEGVILLYYGKRDFDVADNIPLYGFLDFGINGIFLSAIIQVILLFFFEWLFIKFHLLNPFLGLSVIVCIIYNHLNLEYSYVQEFGMIRDLMILLVISSAAKIIYRSFFYKGNLVL